MSTPLATVFVAAPFWAYVDKETGEFDAEAFESINRILTHYDEKGCVVYNAHRREEWGQAFMEPAQFTALDYEQICSSDLVVALPGSPASPGTHIEIGWASASRVPMILLLEKGVEYAGLVTGLDEFATVKVVEFTGEVDLGDLDAAVEEVLTARGQHSGTAG